MNGAARGAIAALLAAAGASAEALYTVDVAARRQRIDHFGASDCWTAQSVGLYPDATRERVADWLFSAAVGTNGQPQGIGLSLWRFNLGAGSAEQGEASGIRSAARRTECFLGPDGRYDWSKQAGQRWFLQAAKRRGVEHFLAFCNSAPAHLTANGLATNTGRPKDGPYNLKPENYGAYARFLATALAGLEAREGVRFDAVSPFNEPEWAWDEAKQEGSPARVADIARLARALDAELAARGLATEILLTESGQIDHLCQAVKGRPEQDRQIDRLFGAQSPDCVAGLRHVPARVAGHSYWTTAPRDVLRAKRRALRAKLDERGLGYWMTELCVMGNDKEVGGGGGRDLTMRTALYVARVIHYDLCVAGASSWQWWLGVSCSDYKDGLVYVTPNKDGSDGAAADSRLLWALGNFSRFVRPGAVRVGVSCASADPDDPDGLMVSAYVHDAGRLLTVVLVNASDQARPVRLGAPDVKVRRSMVYLTSDAPDARLLPQPGADPLAGYEVPARAVVTWAARF
jgi:O-glycosyl hydrolase